MSQNKGRSCRSLKALMYLFCLNMGNSKSTKCDTVSLGMPQRERELHLAVMANDREGVKQLISQGADINYPWSNPTVPSVKDSTTPLLAAVSLNHVEVTQILLKAGADINLTDRNGCSPLYKAAFHGRPVLIDMLLEAGADINKADKEGQSPLYICVQNAIVHSSYAAVRCLLKAGAAIHLSDNLGKTPIHVAAHWKLKDMSRMLLNENADVNKLDNMGRTPLYVCVSSLSTGLYKEDLKYQVPCIKVLFAADCDMLNLVDWLKWKGPGIPDELLADDEQFFLWHKNNMNSPHSLMNLCRKMIQQRLKERGNLLEMVWRLPVPVTLKNYLSRTMFHLPQPNKAQQE
ncbi:serine/threonine-protein phosphatase 6 regulatory ankyrin repeat subunit B-like [Argopecten irradians]|uniref:serine/threonine-protein phosphatase 6 regulatory ankyrin repeat subunit B-like n=1 Tax=Argopecten irradians TaxID=31199 RepID=UPI00371DBB0A